MAGWVQNYRGRLLTPHEKMMKIELEVYAKEMIKYVNTSCAQYYWFKGQIPPVPIYRRWGVPNG